MTRKSLVKKLVARRNAREFDRALRNSSPAMQRELQAIATRQQFGL